MANCELVEVVVDKDGARRVESCADATLLSLRSNVAIAEGIAIEYGHATLSLLLPTRCWL